jgi:hypothetical protein
MAIIGLGQKRAKTAEYWTLWPPRLVANRQINAMKRKPVWYNTLTTNCTTNIVMHIKSFSERMHYNWKILLSGYTPLYAYELGALDTRLPFSELRKVSHINPKAHVLGNDLEFSRKIREGLPNTGFLTKKHN